MASRLQIARERVRVASAEARKRAREEECSDIKRIDYKLTPLGLCFNQPEAAIVCMQCEYALQPSGDCVTRHLGEKHSIPAYARRGLTPLIRELNLPNPNELPSRRDGCSPHPHLAMQTGAACKVCLFRSTSLELVQRHVAKEHGQGSRKQTMQRQQIDNGVLLQSWTQNGRRSYWIVKANDESGLPTASGISDSPHRKKRLEAMHMEECDRLAAGGCESRIGNIEAEEWSCTSNWMRRTNWASMFEVSDRTFLRQLVRMPTLNGSALVITSSTAERYTSPASDERRLAHLNLATDVFLARCEDTIRNSDFSIRCWLRSTFHRRPVPSPFQLPGRTATRVGYKRLWKQFLCFAIRLWRLDPSQRDRLVGFRLAEPATTALETLWGDPWWEKHSQAKLPTWPSQLRPQKRLGIEKCDETEDSEDAGSDWDEDDSDADSGEGKIGHRLPHGTAAWDKSHPPLSAPDRSIDQLADLVGQASAALCQEEFCNGLARSTLLVYFSAVLGICVDGQTFHRPTNYTSKLSGLIYCARLVLFEGTLPLRAHPYIGWPARPAYGQLEKLAAIREKFLCLGCQAPVGELLALRGYGRALSRSDGPTFRVRWSDNGESISWVDGRLGMDDFRQLGRLVLEDATSTLDSLMYGLPRCRSLGSIRDDMSNNKAGYSFVIDPQNDLTTAYLDLSKRACLSSLDGLMRRECWNIQAVNKYLELERELQRQLMLLLYLLGGQAPRSTELFSLECENGPGSLRGIYVQNGKILYVTRHHKSRQTTNREFQVARYMPLEAGGIIFSYLVYVRRFAEMLRRQCWGQEEKSRLLFHTPGRRYAPWTASVLSKSLDSYACKACGISMGVRAYRQLSIAITERHVRDIDRPFNRYDDRSCQADLEVVFAWQSGHRPMQRGTTYGLDAAYPDSLQPALLRVYEWASGEWHRFLGFESEVLRTRFSTEPMVTFSTPSYRSANRVERRKAPDDSPTPLQPSKRLCTQRAEMPTHRVSTIKSAITSKYDNLDQGESTALGEDEQPSKVYDVSPPIREKSCTEQIRYLPDFKALVCIPCGHCIKPPPHSKRHFSDMHSNWPIAKRKELLAYIETLCLVMPDRLTYPDRRTPAVPSLPVYDGWSCTQCIYCCVSEGTMQQHAKQVHSWQKSHVRCWSMARVQTMFSGPDRHFFQVALDMEVTRS